MSRLDDAEPPPSGEPKPGEVLAGKYEVIRVLGSGGMGVVVAARHLQLDQLVALKLLLHDKSAAASERFVREARAAARITSEHVARVLDVGTIPAEDGRRDETAYLVMEHLHGSDLSSLLKTKGPLAIATAVDYVLQACEALAEAHAMGIVHRDLKPANLFLAVRADGSPLVKVLDFGISKSLTPDPAAKDLTATNMILGTPQYMAPEQAHGSKNVDVRTDVWALGAILHELVTGGPPFVAESVQGVLAAILVEPPIPLRSKRRDAPADLEAAVARCLEKDAAKRFADIGAFCAAIAPFASPGAKESIERIARVAQRGLAAESAAAIAMRGRDPGAPTGSSAAPGWFRGRRVLLGIVAFLVGIAAVIGVATYSRSETQETADVATKVDAGAEPSAHTLHLPPTPATGAAHTEGPKHPHAQPAEAGRSPPCCEALEKGRTLGEERTTEAQRPRRIHSVPSVAPGFIPLMTYTLPFSAVTKADLPRVGGKGANLGELTRAGVRVPPGFCVTTAAFDRFLAALPDAEQRFAELDALDPGDVDAAQAAAARMRQALAALPMPADVAEAVVRSWRELGEERALAVRSSATAEDLPGASFAGQQDTYLNIRGEAATLDAVRRCWISLFTDRAVLYRARGGFGHRTVKLGVVVQELVDPEVSGILFTADPVTGHRRLTSIDAGFGLGEALVGGLINADLYKVDRRTGDVIVAQPGDKAFAIRSLPGGGTTREPLADDQRKLRALDDATALALSRIGERIEELYQSPQDIEWCIAGGTIYIVQARPITSLYPLAEPRPEDASLHVYLSFGHLQMMLDAMPRLSLDVWQLFFPAAKTVGREPPERSRAMREAGSRLFIDATGVLRVPRARKIVLGLLAHAYELLGKSAAALLDRPEFLSGRGSGRAVLRAALRIMGPVLGRVPLRLFWSDPAANARAFDRAVEDLPRASAERIAALPSPGERMRQAAREIDGVFFRVRRFLANVLSGVAALGLLARMFPAQRADLGLLVRGLPGNVTTEMDLAVGDLGDLLKPHPELQRIVRDRPWSEARVALAGKPGGDAFLEAMERFVARYGARGASEIDLSRPRWRDEPALLLRVMTGGLGAAVAAHRRHHEAQVAEGEAAAERLTRATGPLTRWLVRRLVRVARYGLGQREHPKWLLVQIFGVVRNEALAGGALLAERGQLERAEDVWHLGFDELADALDEPSLDRRELVASRAAAWARDRGRKPPIAFSSDGEIAAPKIDRADLPSGALPGTAASAGVVEGIARVITNPERETLHAGEILVAPFTDPGWTPLFVHAAGVVTEVGGVMTHGAVVAREYGIPAVVSVTHALDRIRTGQRIRVDGTRGFVEILAEEQG